MGGVEPELGVGPFDAALGVEGDHQLGADLLAVELGGQLGQRAAHLGRGLEGDVGVLLAPEPLDHVDLGVNSRPLRLRSSSSAAVLEVLGADAGDQMSWPAVVVPGRVRARCRRWAGCSVAPSTVGGQEVHGRRADEPGDEQVDRLLVELAGHVDLLEHAPLRSTATRSPSVMASIWSWVT